MEQKKYDNFQDLFNDIYTRITKQGEGSFGLMKSFTQCKYRNGTLACAIGIVLSDKTVQDLKLEANNPAMGSNNDFSATENVCRALFNFTDERQASFLEEMQQAHDDACSSKDFIVSFQSKAARVADNFGLEVPLV